ncbi:hypothetical protein A2U01_0048876, partial [Trifolium medium]|nr:hypothetical protein [Trifolium medium]
KVDTFVNDPVIKDVEEIVNASVTLGVGHANPADVLEKPDLSPPADDNPMIGASTEAKVDYVNDSLKETPPETTVVPDVDTYVARETDVPNVDTTVVPETVLSQDTPGTPDQMTTTEKEKTPDETMTGNAITKSQTDESTKTVEAEIEEDPSVDKDMNDDADVVIVDDIVSKE